jgi:hypothetical protein
MANIPRACLENIQDWLDMATDTGLASASRWCTDETCCTNTNHTIYRLFQDTLPLAIMLQTCPGATPKSGLALELSLLGQGPYELASVVFFSASMGHFYCVFRAYDRFYCTDPYSDSGVCCPATGDQLRFIRGGPKCTDEAIGLCYTLARQYSEGFQDVLTALAGVLVFSRRRHPPALT